MIVALFPWFCLAFLSARIKMFFRTSRTLRARSSAILMDDSLRFKRCRQARSMSARHVKRAIIGLGLGQLFPDRFHGFFPQRRWTPQNITDLALLSWILRLNTRTSLTNSGQFSSSVSGIPWKMRFHLLL